MHKEMKDSRIDWIKHIPAHWKIHPIYSYFNERKNKNSLGKENNLLSLSYGRIIRKNINTTEGLLPKSFNTYHIVEAGDIIIRPTDLQNDKRSLRTGLVKEHGIITSAYIDLAPKKALDPRYFHYLLHSYDISKVFYNMGNGVRQSLSFPEFSHLMMIEPPLEEQKQIADFLDYKCDEIDTLHADIEKQIVILEDYKKSIITEAVTKGLNPDVEMKDSGIEWIGKIPQNWKVIKVKRLLAERNTRSSDGSEEPLSMSQKYGLIPTKEMDNVPLQPATYVGAKLTYIGDLVFNKLKAHLGVFSVSNYTGLVSPDYAVYYAKNNTNIKFLEYLFKTNLYITEFKKRITGVGSGLSRLYTSGLFDIPAIYPPLEEQNRIVEFIDTQLLEINMLISNKQQQLDILDNYKKSLIYEYVTGKKEVSSYANAE